MCGQPWPAYVPPAEEGLEPLHPRMPGTTTMGELAELLLEAGYDEIPRELHSLTLTDLNRLLDGPQR